MRPPDATYVKQRWIPLARIEYLKHCSSILVGHGSVVADESYRTRDAARGHVRRIRDDMVDLRLHESWQLRQHVEKINGSWIWSIEYLGRNGD